MVFAEKMAYFGLWDFLGTEEIGGDGIIDDIDTKSLYKLVELLEQCEHSTQSQKNSTPLWPEKSSWTETNIFEFTLNGKKYNCEFDDKKDNSRLEIFRELIKAKGEIVTNTKLTRAGNVENDKHKPIISQLEKNFEIKKIPIKILSEKTGGYKIVFTAK
jgi:predicted transcriptional regulator